jgi:hypothetical protein
MKFQFGTNTLLLATTVIAIALGGIIGWARFIGMLPEKGILWVVEIIPFTAPIWLPIALVAFAIGRKAFTVRMVVLLAIAQAVGVGIAYLMQNYI